MSAFGRTLSPALQRLGAVSVKLSVELGTTKMALKDVLALAEGSVVSLDKQTDELLDVTANGQVIARGEVIAQNGKFALRIVSLAGGEGAVGSSPGYAPRPDAPPRPVAKPESKGPISQSSLEPTDQASSKTEPAPEPEEAAADKPAPDADANALLDALDELTDTPSPEGADDPETDKQK